MFSEKWNQENPNNGYKFVHGRLGLKLSSSSFNPIYRIYGLQSFVEITISGGCQEVAEMVSGDSRHCKDAIYEDYEGSNSLSSSSSSSSNEKFGNVVMFMNTAYNGGEAMQKTVCLNGSSSSSLGSTLQQNIWAWCEATGLPTSITVHVENRSFKLHKYPLVSKSGYLKRSLSYTSEITLPLENEIFELVANFCYGSAIYLDPFNVAALRCAAEFLEMTEEYGRGNICERSDLYLTQVALQSWEDTLVVLQKCLGLLPLADEIQIVSRCVESLAHMACMEVLDPEQRKVKSAQLQLWSDISGSVRQTSNREWWIKDLLALPSELFERVIISLREQGMDEMIIGRVIVQYSTKWIVFEKRQQIGDDITGTPERNGSLKRLLECVIRLLPLERYPVPLDFLFSLLHKSLGCNLNSKYKTQLEARIASQLENATIDYFLLPMSNTCNGSGLDSKVESMKRIVSTFMHQQSVRLDECELKNIGSNSCSFMKIFTVANLWDEYLALIANNTRLSPRKFSELVGILPSSTRSSHDLLYKAVHTYLTAHPGLSEEDRLAVCTVLNCQKLSQEACVHAVQSELMPLRLIVQAMFTQQLQTHQCIRSNSESSQFVRNDNIDSPSCLNNNDTSILSSHFLLDDIRCRNTEPEDGLPLGLILKRDAAFRQAAYLKADYEATSFRLKNLEEELMAMKDNLDRNREESGKSRHIFSRGKSESFRVISINKPVDTGCTRRLGNTLNGSTNWLSQRKIHGNFAKKFLKTLQQLGFRKAQTDQNNEAQDVDPCPRTEASAVEADQYKGYPQRNRSHSRNYSLS